MTGETPHRSASPSTRGRGVAMLVGVAFWAALAFLSVLV